MLYPFKAIDELDEEEIDVKAGKFITTALKLDPNETGKWLAGKSVRSVFDLTRTDNSSINRLMKSLYESHLSQPILSNVN
ncbi:MAG: hypothetical protein U0176_13725 [Bacteroidia bacterium]